MMDIVLLVYIMGLAIKVSQTLGFLVFFGVIGYFGMLVIWLFNKPVHYPPSDSTYQQSKEYWDGIGKGLRKSLTPLVFIVSLGVLVPSPSTVNRMAVAYAADAVAQTEAASQLGTKSLAALNKLFDEYLEEEEDDVK